MGPVEPLSTAAVKSNSTTTPTTKCYIIAACVVIAHFLLASLYWSHSTRSEFGTAMMMIAPPPPPDSQPWSPTQRSCRFYMDLPGPNWTHAFLHVVAHRGKWNTVLYSGPLTFPNSTLYQVGQRSLEMFVWHYLWKHPWRTFSEFDADIFFAPAIVMCSGLSHLGNLHRRAGQKSCWETLTDTKNRSVVKHGPNASFSIYSRPNRYYLGHHKTYDGMLHVDGGVKGTVETFKFRTPKGHGPWVGIPYISSYLHRAGPFAPLVAAAELHSKPRKWLASGFFNTYKGTKIVRGIRGKIKLECAARTNLCAIPSKGELGNSTMVGVMNLFRQSIFAFQPPGDSFARKSLWDSLSQGAIPAIFHTHSFHYPVIHADPYNNIVVLLDHSENILDQLLRIPQSEIARMQRNIRQNYHKFFYRDYRWSNRMVSYAGGNQARWPDAMETFMLHMCDKVAGRPMPLGYGKPPKDRFGLFKYSKKYVTSGCTPSGDPLFCPKELGTPRKWGI